jgi:hypothetical protein
MHAERFTIKKQTVTRAALIAITAGLSLGASVAHAQIVDSGPVSIAIPATTAGIYLNVLTGVSGTAAATPGWDFNPWGATSRQFFWTTTATTNGGGDATGTVYRALNPGDTVGPASTFINLTATAASANFQAIGDRIIGFRFLNETGGTVHYGYAVLNSAAATGVPGTITRYVFQATPNTAITVVAPGGGATAPQFGFTPAPGATVAATGGGTVGSTGALSIAVAVATAGSGTGAPATTTTTCTAPTAPFSGFGQTVTAVGTGAITGGPLAGTCTLGTAAATQTLTCVETRGTVPTTRTWTLSCPAGTAPPVVSVPVNATSAWSLIALMLALFGFAAVAVRRQG